MKSQKGIDLAIVLRLGSYSLATHDSERLQRSDLRVLIKFRSMLSKRFKCLGESADLDQAIAIDEKEITLALHAQHTFLTSLSCLTVLLRTCAKH